MKKLITLFALASFLMIGYNGAYAQEEADTAATEMADSSMAEEAAMEEM